MTGVDPVIAWVIRLGLALLFGAAAWHKLRDLRGFAATVTNYRIVPPALSAPMAGALGLAELGVAILLLAGVLGISSGSTAPLAALALLTLYSGALTLNLARGRRDLDCGCMGPASRQLISPALLVRNATLAIGPLVLLGGVASRSLGWIDLLSVIGATAMLAIFWNAAHQLAAAPPHELRSERAS
jgi:uncharacterized membrane protein YphA (DoxX/SURF4 family)